MDIPPTEFDEKITVQLYSPTKQPKYQNLKYQKQKGIQQHIFNCGSIALTCKL